jgi:hypothetical protein
MRITFLLRVAAAVFVATIAVGQAVACKCSSGFHGKNAWELAKLESEGSAAIFEGTPEHFEVEWSVLNAKVGELIPSEDPSAGPGGWPRMAVTFRIQRAYKGDLGPEVKITTGLGGGDCGAVFAPGVVYLVFAGKMTTGELGVSMCSPGGWIGGSNTAVELRYLRKETAVGDDLAIIRRWGEKEYAAQEAQRRRDADEFLRRYAAATGQVCGTVSSDKTRTTGMVSFLSTRGFSPYVPPTAYIHEDGSFCSGRLGPGKYYLYFTVGSEAGERSPAFYPGVSQKEKATTVEVTAGQTQSGILFRVPTREGHSVRGVVFIYAGPGVKARTGYVTLIKLDGGAFPGGQSQRIDFASSSAFPKLKYFKFENVFPGRYTAYVGGFGKGWYTRKEEVLVADHMKFVALDLFRQK